MRRKLIGAVLSVRRAVALLREQRFGMALAVPAAPVPAGIGHFRIRSPLRG